MKTLTITEGRGRLGYWLKKATLGEDVGFMFEGKIVALRPVEVVSTDYALREYGLTPNEMAAAEKRIPCFTSLDTARVAVDTLLNGVHSYHIERLSDYRKKEHHEAAKSHR